MKTFAWKEWKGEVPKTWESNPNASYFEIIIPNVEIYKLRKVMELH